MTLFLNRCVWNPTAGGLADFVVSSAFAGAYTPAQCLDPVVTDGGSYHYFAQTSDNTQHEEGDGIYSVATSTLTRATIRNSSSSGAKVNFSQAPIITMGGPTSLEILPIQVDPTVAPNALTIQAPSVLPGTPSTAGTTWNLKGSLSTGGLGPGNISFDTGFTGLTTAGPQTCTISIASPAIVTANNNGIPPNCPVYFTTTGALPTGLSPLTTYYIEPFSWNSLFPNQFEVSATNGGPGINTTGTQSGVHTVTVGGAVTISIASPAVITLPFHMIVPGQTITFQTTGALPTGISASVTYFVIFAGLNQNVFQISTTLNGPAVNTSGAQSGTHTIQIQGGTVQNPAQPAMVIGPSASTLQGSVNSGVGLSALTLNMVNASWIGQPNTAFSFNIWNIGPYESIVFDFLDVPNNVARWFMSFTPNQDFRTGISGLPGESSRIGISLSTDLDDRLTFGLNASDVPGYGLGPGSGLLDTFIARVTPGVFAFGTVQGNALGWFNYGGQARVTADFPVTSSAVLVNVTGLSVNVAAGRSYAFDVYLTCTDAAAGGVQAAIGGSCTATAIEYDGWTLDSNVIKGQTNATALATAVASTLTTSTAGIVILIKGLITVNAAGTLTVQFAQNTSNGTASTVKRGSHFIVQDLQ